MYAFEKNSASKESPMTVLASTRMVCQKFGNVFPGLPTRVQSVTPASYFSKSDEILLWGLLKQTKKITFAGPGDDVPL